MLEGTKGMRTQLKIHPMFTEFFDQRFKIPSSCKVFPK